MDQVVSRRLWAEVAKSLWDGFDSASAKAKGNFMKKLRTRWRSMKDRFNKGIRAAEEQARSGAAASKSVPYKYNRALQFLRPVLTRRQTHSSTLERAPPCEAELHGSPSDPSQPSHSDSRLAPPSSGEPAAGTSGFPLPEASGAPSFGNSRQRQRASDRSVMPEFLHLGTVFQNGFKALSDKMSSMERRLEILEAELSNPAKHFLSTIAKGMVENLTPELQISVMQDCNNSYVRALQQSRRMQSATLPVVEVLSKGLSFSLVEGSDYFTLIKDLELFAWKLIFKKYFAPKSDPTLTQTELQVLSDLESLEAENFQSDSPAFPTHLHLRSKTFPPLSACPQVEIFVRLIREDFHKLNPCVLHDNLTPRQRIALRELGAMKDVVIKRADKGGNVVLWPIDLYEAEAFKQLLRPDHYKKFDALPLAMFQRELSHLLDEGVESQAITTKMRCCFHSLFLHSYICGGEATSETLSGSTEDIWIDLSWTYS
ncbi:uncharacterized protein LOC143803952 [Ranitomeya variabilis]|uniref:uncharacterized protein LOC143803952 n=1 Tax=Ranitomeya variabilis TaxID=490064 RepID=UPI0040567833